MLPIDTATRPSRFDDAAGFDIYLAEKPIPV